MKTSAPIFLLVLAVIGCSKFNYLEVGKTAIVTDNQGIYLRATPSTQGRKILLIPIGQNVKILAEGLPEKLYDIESKWYRVSYGKHEGWMWGGLAKKKERAQNQEPSTEDQRIHKKLAGRYIAGDNELVIKCDGTFWTSGYHQGFSLDSSGLIINAKFRTTETVTKRCDINEPSKPCQRNLDTTIHEQNVDEFMQAFQLTDKTKCK